MISTKEVGARSRARALAAKCLRLQGRQFLAVMACGFVVSTAVRATDATFQYDELGRLTEIVTSDGKSARYKYDDASNLTAVTNIAAGKVTISNFSPDQGAVGSTVTITGTGFNATPGNNVVTFNGVAATVGSATASQLTATVPPGATTGVIKVSNGASTATTTNSFTVTATSGKPGIASISPNIGNLGTVVTITGHDFDVAPTNDKVSFGATTGPVSTATTTQLQLAVPSWAGSGHIGLQTPAGTATAGSDFYAVPTPYSASTASGLGRLTVDGGGVAFSLTANHQGLVLFDATFGQYLTLDVTSPTIPNGTVKVYDPHGQYLGGAAFASSGGGIELPRIPLSGTYTIFIDPGLNSGQLTLSLLSPLAGTLVLGMPQSVTISGPTRRNLFAFAGQPGNYYSLLLQPNPGQPALTGSVSIMAAGREIAQGTLATGPSRILLPPLPVNGPYTVLFSPDIGASGILGLLMLPVVTGPFSSNLQTTTSFTAAEQGQLGRYVMAAAQQGAIYQILIDSDTVGTTTDPVTISIYRPSDPVNPWVSTTHSSALSGVVWTLPAIPESGDYVVLVTPGALLTGSVNFRTRLTSSSTGGTVVGSYWSGYSVPANALGAYILPVNAGQSLALNFASNSSGAPIAPPSAMAAHAYDSHGVDKGACTVVRSVCYWSFVAADSGTYMATLGAPAGVSMPSGYVWAAGGYKTGSLAVAATSGSNATTAIDLSEPGNYAIGDYSFTVSTQSAPNINPGISFTSPTLQLPANEFNFIDGPPGLGLMTCNNGGAGFGCYVPPSVLSQSGAYYLRLDGITGLNYAGRMNVVGAYDVTGQLPMGSSSFTSIPFTFANQHSRHSLTATYSSSAPHLIVTFASLYQAPMTLNLYRADSPNTVLSTASQANGQWRTTFSLPLSSSASDYILEIVPNSAQAVTMQVKLTTSNQ